MCFPHKMWIKEWQNYHNQTHSPVKCKRKFRFERISRPVGYVYDDAVLHRSLVSRVSRPDALTVNNWDAYHVCVDGGLIRFGCRNYMSSNQYPQGRCDSIIFDRNDLWFIEFKMNTTSGLDGQLWKDVKDGMSQLKDFIHNLRRKMSSKRNPLKYYYKVRHQHCTVSMTAYPRMNPSRQNHLEDFRIDTGIKLQLQAVIP